ncbi:DUF933 domain-containing protein [Candidatus Dependentiae bacterium]|nr:DUF933 domain-containing protein [Candidatus Dependentiae bacterium]
MRAIIIGYPYSGKTVFFDAISGAVSNEIQKNSSNIRNIKVMDKRLSKLRDIYNPKKYSPAEINVFDNFVSVSEFGKENTIFTRSTIENIQKSEVTILVIRAFDNSGSPYFKEKIEPLKDFKSIIEEMCFLDLISAEKKIERLKKENAKTKEFDIISKCYETLQNNNPVFSMNLNEDETAQLSGFKFLTQNKIMSVINVDDNTDEKELSEIEKIAGEKGINILKLNAKIEFEISQFESEEEKLEFLKDYGLSESVVDRFVTKVYSMMGLISFFTVGPDEVKAWTIRKDTSAVKAAGKIHTDIQRGFIRAEIFDSELFFRYEGNMQKIKTDGKLRLEGKEYIVKDGEIINFRFNV